MVNLLRTGLLLAALTALFMAVGYWIGGEQGMIFALVLAGIGNFFAYWSADRVVLGMYGAHEVDDGSAGRLVGLVRQLAGRAGLPMPRVYVIDNPQPNAFATGRDPAHAAVAVTSGLLQALPERELAGVLAHELGHIRNRDTLTMTVAATLAGAVGMLASFAFFLAPLRGNERDNPLGLVGGLLIMVLAPIAATIVQLAISRTREFAADRTGAEIAGEPMWLASALGIIDGIARRVPNETAEHNPATAHLFIVSPLSGARLGSLFATHPPAHERIARLQAMAGFRSPWVRGGSQW